MRAIDADRLLSERMKSKYYHLPNGDIAIPLIDIEHAPTVGTGSWIPITERLPENNNPVNVTWVNHNPAFYYAGIKDKPFTATAHYHRGHWYWYSSVTQDNIDEYGTWTLDLVDKDVEITAWMPLPEPYKGVTT